MSKYTTELRFLCEAAAGLSESEGFDSIENILTTAAPVIFNFPFPIFDETYRLALERKILRHFYTREICEETVGLWKLRLCDKLNMTMPYYNKLYESALLEFNPLYDVNVTRTHTRNITENTTSQNSSQTASNETRTNNSSVGTMGTDSNTHWDVYSDTPQGGIDGIEGSATENGNTVDTMYYLTTARKVTDTGSDTRNTTSNDTTTDAVNSSTNASGNTGVQNAEQYAETVIGKQGGVTYSKMLKEFRETILNIDEMVIEELRDLFFGLWN